MQKLKLLVTVRSTNNLMLTSVLTFLFAVEYLLIFKFHVETLAEYRFGTFFGFGLVAISLQ